MSEIAVEVQDVWYAYPDGTEALRGVNLRINRGEFIAIIGQNGSGKTTLVKQFNGLLRPTRGDVSIFGTNTKTLSVAQQVRRVGYVFQNPDHQLSTDSVENEVEFGMKNLGVPLEERKRKVEEYLAKLDLVSLKSEHPYFLSKADRQRVAFASTLAMETDVLVVDEPTTGMDAAQSYSALGLLRNLNENGKTIVIITHNMRLVAEFAKRCVVMCRGQVLMDGPTRNVFSKPDVLKETFLEPPMITTLGSSLGNLVTGTILTVNELVEALG